MKKPKPTTPRASDGARRQAAYERRLKEAGWRRVSLWIAPDIDVDKVRAYAAKKWGAGA